jgi:multimeric flavodoxin WrbA
MKILAIIGSQRKEGNSYAAAKEVLEPTKTDYEIIQLADKEIGFCDFCGKCQHEKCHLKDDFNQIIQKMKKADAVVFSFPRYFSLSSKFLCFIERLTTPHHYKEYKGYRISGVEPDPSVSLPFKAKPCCLFVVSGTGYMGKKPMKLVAHEVKKLGMNVVAKVLLKGEEREDVLKDKKGLEKCKKSVEKLIHSME